MRARTQAHDDCGSDSLLERAEDPNKSAAPRCYGVSLLSMSPIEPVFQRVGELGLVVRHEPQRLQKDGQTDFGEGREGKRGEKRCHRQLSKDVVPKTRPWVPNSPSGVGISDVPNWPGERRSRDKGGLSRK